MGRALYDGGVVLMVRRTLLCACVVLSVNCLHEMQNPSDPEADGYSVTSRATVSITGSSVQRVGDTVRFSGGVTSKGVQEADLLKKFEWDFNGDGKTDTVIEESNTVGYVYEKTGEYRCRLKCTDRARYSDTASILLRVRPPSWGMRITIILRFGDTLHVTINSEDPITVFSGSGDTVIVIPHAKGESISVVAGVTGDTIDIPLVDADTISLTAFRIETITPPSIPIYIPDFPTIDGFPDSLRGDCAIFAGDSALMHTNLQFYDIMWEQTKDDGLESIEFVEKLLADIVGYSIITLVGNDYTYTFNRGVYAFTSDDFQISCAFHYGDGIGTHAENDTVRSDLFTLDSYVGAPKVVLNPPSYSFTKGPLYELIDGDVSIDASLNVSFSVNFSKLKISFFRTTVTEVPEVPLYVVNDSLRLQTTHTSFTRMAPVYVRDFPALFQNDSLLIDHGGTSMETEPAPLKVVFRTDTSWQRITYAFTVKQVIDSQKTAYGKSNDVLKVAGTYSTMATLGFDGHDQSIWFGGRYSSTVNDSSWFYCDRQKTSEFGTLFFGVVTDSIGTFTSEPYGYGFEYVPLGVSLTSYVSLFR
ncbi:MAG: PKD domain-containing protein [Chitinispirillaceae bacterium]|nr:PKD domain-containing protein [Chitinispirillaceae bacterium]